MKKIFTVMMVAVILFGTSLLNAEIVFDNGEPTIFTDVGNNILGWLQTEDFVLTQDTFLTGAYFWTLEQNTFTWDNTLEYFIFTDNAGIPGTAISTGDGQSVQKVATGNVTPVAPEYEYSFEFETPVSLVANETYWFGLHLASGYPSGTDYWFGWWSPSVSGIGSTNFESEGGTLDNWSDTGIHRAFYLEGIPEPATILLLGVGGLVLVRRIRQNPG